MSKRYKKYLTSKNIILFILLFMLFFLLRWNSYSAPFERDEGEYAYSAWIMRKGVMPYENSFMQKPPMIIYTYAIGQVFDSQGIVSPRILSSLFVFSATILLGLIARKSFGKNAGWVVMFLVTPMLTLPYNTPFAANTENFMLLPLIALLFIYVYKRTNATYMHFFLSGILASITLLYKPIGLTVIAFIYGIWVYELFKQKKDVKKILLKLSAVAIGGLFTVFIVFLPFVITGTTKPLIESAFLYNLSYTGFEGFGIANIFNYIGGKYIRVYWPLYILVVYYLFKRPKRWWYYIGLFLSALLAVYSSPMGHYYILIMPFWALVCGHAVTLLSKEKKINEVLGRSADAVITIIVLVIIIFPFRSQFSLTPQELSIWMYGTVNPFVDAYVVSGEVEKITTEDESIFVAGSEPEIYFYAKRLSPTKFVITYPLNITSDYQEKYQKEIVEDLNETNPEVIIVSNMRHSGLWNEGSPRIFIDYLDELVEKEYEFYGAYLWGRDKGYWLKDLTEEELNSASLVVYTKSD